VSIEDDFRETIQRAVKNALEGRSEDEVAQFVADGRLYGKLDEMIADVGAHLAETLVETSPAMLADRLGQHATVADEVRRIYGPGLDLCEMVLHCAHELCDEYAERELEDDGGPALEWVIAHLHARACRVGEEALMLLKAGYGPGGYSRWRSLHEIVVVGSFIAEHGAETAVRYADHLAVHRWRLLRDTDASSGLDEIGKEALAEAQAEVDALEERHGADFTREYGWAAKALPDAAHNGFRALEKATKFEHLRFDYRQASAGIHANASMVLEPPDAQHRGSTLLVGPSPFAIATPAHAVAISLIVSTGTLMNSVGYTSTGYVLTAMLDLCDRAADALSAAEPSDDADADS